VVKRQRGGRSKDTRRALLFGMVGMLVSLVAACTGSSKHNERVPGATLFVEVQDRNGRLVPDATVTTQPATKTHTTDAAGSTLFTDVAPGFYSVLAVHQEAGAASQALELRSRELSSVFLVLDGALQGSGGSGASGGSGGTGGTGGSGATGGSSGRGSGGSSGGNATARGTPARPRTDRSTWPRRSKRCWSIRRGRICTRSIA